MTVASNKCARQFSVLVDSHADWPELSNLAIQGCVYMIAMEKGAGQPSVT